MILSKTAKVKIINLTINHYSEKGYFPVINEILEVNTEDLTPSSRILIKCICDSCNLNFETSFRNLSADLNNILCKKCRSSKAAKERIKHHGSAFSDSAIQKKIATKYQNNPTKLQEIDHKKKSTRHLKYGDITWNNQEKRISTGRSKKKDWVNSDKRKLTCLQKYGNSNWNNQNKKKETCMIKYGVEHTQQLEEIFSKSIKLNRFNNISYQGTYELDFLETFFDTIKIERGKSIFYIDNDGIQRRYFPDFYCMDMNLIVEIKSSYTLKSDKNAILKREAALKEGFDFLWIVDKDYSEFKTKMKQL